MKLSHSFYGVVLLFAALLLVVTQIEGFKGNIGIIIIVLSSVAVIAICIIERQKYFAVLPIPFAVLYITILQEPLNLPKIDPWFLCIASVLVSGSLFLFFKQYQQNALNYTIRTVSSSNDNNPTVNVNFGGVNWHLNADNLKTVKLRCTYGVLNVFFNKTESSPNGIVVEVDLEYGGIWLNVPRHWRIINMIGSCVCIDRNFAATPENAPRLTLTGRVLYGGVNVLYV